MCVPFREYPLSALIPPMPIEPCLYEARDARIRLMSKAECMPLEPKSTDQQICNEALWEIARNRMGHREGSYEYDSQLMKAADDMQTCGTGVFFKPDPEPPQSEAPDANKQILKAMDDENRRLLDDLEARRQNRG